MSSKASLCVPPTAATTDTWHDVNGDTISVDTWHDTDGAIHRGDDRPAVVHRHNRKKFCSVWYRYGSVHRDGGKPAVAHKMRCNDVMFRAWYDDGALTREVYVSGDGETLSDMYYYEKDHVTPVTNPLLGRVPPVTGTWLDKWMSTY